MLLRESLVVLLLAMLPAVAAAAAAVGSVPAAAIAAMLAAVGAVSLRIWVSSGNRVTENVGTAPAGGPLAAAPAKHEHIRHSNSALWTAVEDSPQASCLLTGGRQQQHANVCQAGITPLINHAHHVTLSDTEL
jgi:hypothetical protein